MNLPKQCAPVSRTMHDAAPETNGVEPSWQFRCFDDMLYFRKSKGSGSPLPFECTGTTGWGDGKRCTGVM